MGIRVVVDDQLLAEAQKISGETDQQKLLSAALQALIDKHKTPLQRMLELAGSGAIADDYDYKKLRSDDHDPD